MEKAISNSRIETMYTKIVKIKLKIKALQEERESLERLMPPAEESGMIPCDIVTIFNDAGHNLHLGVCPNCKKFDYFTHLRCFRCATRVLPNPDSPVCRNNDEMIKTFELLGWKNHYDDLRLQAQTPKESQRFDFRAFINVTPTLRNYIFSKGELTVAEVLAIPRAELLSVKGYRPAWIDEDREWLTKFVKSPD